MAIRQKFKMVQNDQMPDVWLSLTDDITKDPIDLSDVGTSVHAHVKLVGDKTIKADLVCDKLPGVVIAVDEDTGAQTISMVPPYDTPGRGGRCAIVWEQDTLDVAGTYQVEISVQFVDGRTMTWYDLLQFLVREEFA